MKDAIKLVHFVQFLHLKGNFTKNFRITCKEVKITCSSWIYRFLFCITRFIIIFKRPRYKNGLELLIEEVEKIEGIKTARILYLYPSTTTLSLIDKIADSNVFVNYFDMPLQHITPSMLKIMKEEKVLKIK